MRESSTAVFTPEASIARFTTAVFALDAAVSSGLALVDCGVIAKTHAAPATTMMIAPVQIPNAFRIMQCSLNSPGNRVILTIYA